MRVNYTLPGLLPAETAVPETARTRDSPFRARINVPPAPRWLDWRSLLHLDDAPVNAVSMGPPPRPAGMESRDAAAARLAWREMLDRQVSAFEEEQPDSGQTARGDTQAVERMLTLLMRFQEVEDAIAARHLAESEG